ncbi:hypothetical protein B0H13DRAFT_2437656 [Mycena leptocephala]|nr:hypothetical protein B0H13DRAFT_2437656 [Mycena leptocephala]
MRVHWRSRAATRVSCPSFAIPAVFALARPCSPAARVVVKLPRTRHTSAARCASCTTTSNLRAARGACATHKQCQRNRLPPLSSLLVPHSFPRAARLPILPSHRSLFQYVTSDRGGAVHDGDPIAIHARSSRRAMHGHSVCRACISPRPTSGTLGSLLSIRSLLPVILFGRSIPPTASDSGGTR